MKTCLDFGEILEIGRPQIDELHRVGEAFPDADSEEACGQFTIQVRRLEGIVLTNYRVAAALARKGDDLREVASLWASMSQFCQAALQVLAQLKDRYPGCGTPELYDLVLDYKLAADKRYKGVAQELECLTTDLPKGLLPELS